MQTDIKKASETDSIEDALDYKAITKRIKDFMENNQFELIETLAERIAQLILQEFNVPWLRLSVSTLFAIRDSKHVGLTIERSSQ